VKPILYSLERYTTVPLLREPMADFLVSLRSKVYSGGIKSAVRKLHLNHVFSDPYWKVVFWLDNDTQTHSIAEQTVSFYIETFDEFMRFRNLMGRRPVIENLLHSLSPEDVFYDIEINVGTYTCVTASKPKLDAVVAFEQSLKARRE
jgi:hypothetical protein